MTTVPTTYSPSLAQFAKWQRNAGGLSPNTVKLRDRQLKLYEREVGPIEVATKQSLEAFLDSRLLPDGEPVSSKTRSCYIVSYSAYFRWAINNEVLPDRICALAKDHDGGHKSVTAREVETSCGQRFTEDPTAKLDKPKIHLGSPDPIDEDDLARALSLAKPMMRVWLLLGAYGAFRCCEVATLCREDIDEAGWLHIRSGKGGKSRSIPSHPLILEAIEAANLPASGRLFPEATATSVSQRTNRFLHNRAHSRFTMHKLRHRCLTMAYRATKDILAVQKMAGHSSVATTQIYAKAADDAVQGAVLALPMPKELEAVAA